MKIPNSVYEPEDDSYLMEKCVIKYSRGLVLEIGCGSGINSFAALKSNLTKYVVGVDINSEAIKYCNNQKKFLDEKRIMFFQSDLFSKINKANRISKIFSYKFETIIFNPPYLPQEKREDPNISLIVSGGKHGYEIYERFLSSAYKYLKSNGQILLLLSSLTKPEKVVDFIEKYGFVYEKIEELKISFETLYIYRLTKNPILVNLEKKGMFDFLRLAKGKRGVIYTAKFDSHKVCIKIKRENSKALGRIKNEGVMLKKVNKFKIGPKLRTFSDEYVVYDYVKGEPILNFLLNSNKDEIKPVLINILKQLKLLDNFGLDKEEMHHPHKHILINKKKVVQIDFERAHYTINVKNVTQFLQYIRSMRKVFLNKNLVLDENIIYDLSRNYSKNMDNSNFNKILKYIKNL